MLQAWEKESEAAAQRAIKLAQENPDDPAAFAPAMGWLKLATVGLFGLWWIADIFLLLGGKPIVSLLFGRQFLGAYDALVILMLVPFLSVFSFPLPPMLYALDRPDAPLTARLIGTGAFFLLIAPLAWRFGVVGAAIAFVIGNAATVFVMMWQLRQEHRRVRPAKAQPSSR